jgi:hypothetical protein
VTFLTANVSYLSSDVITLVVFLEIGLVALWVAVGSGRQRRSHFWVRISAACLAVPALIAILIATARSKVLPNEAARALLPFLLLVGVIALMLVPGVLYRGSGSSPGPSDSDGGGGGGPGPGQPPRPPDAPRGGIPLPDADQARVRARDHIGPRFRERARRRTAHEPGRSPAPISM